MTLKIQREGMKKKQKPKSFELEYNETLQAMVLCILDSETMCPFYLKDPEAGLYKVVKTSQGKLHMVK